VGGHVIGAFNDAVSTTERIRERVGVIMIHVEFFWVMTFSKLYVPPEDGGIMVLRNVSVLPQHYMASQPRRT
jgi:hypothetical protein